MCCAAAAFGRACSKNPTRPVYRVRYFCLQPTEVADQGTLFLDEVGDIPIEIQPKLLRALQEREFERLGSTHTRKVNVRVVAATNRDLEKMIANKEFRSDLYYRLKVFPTVRFETSNTNAGA